jgi:thiamine biosynthesis lipoprotein
MIYTSIFRAMGCRVEIKLETTVSGEAILTTMPERFEALEDQLSRFRPHSELMRFNAMAGEWVTLSDALFENMHQAKHMARLTDGLFNPLILPALIANGYDRSFEQLIPGPVNRVQPVPDWHDIALNVRTHQARIPAGSAVDLGGIAKGWSAQYLCSELAAYGPCLVNIGGDIAVSAAPKGLPGWHINIADPDSDIDLTAVCLHDTAIVTSGIDFRHWTSTDQRFKHHIIHPRTGEPAVTDVRTVTIIHAHAPTTEAYAKAVLLLGSETGLQWINSRWNAAALVVRQDGAVLATNNFVSYLQERNTQ